jgi:hypothetical protein
VEGSGADRAGIKSGKKWAAWTSLQMGVEDAYSSHDTFIDWFRTLLFIGII